jgi:hypothetical protein
MTTLDPGSLELTVKAFVKHDPDRRPRAVLRALSSFNWGKNLPTRRTRKYAVLGDVARSAAHATTWRR